MRAELRRGEPGWFSVCAPQGLDAQTAGAALIGLTVSPGQIAAGESSTILITLTNQGIETRVEPGDTFG